MLMVEAEIYNTKFNILQIVEWYRYVVGSLRLRWSTLAINYNMVAHSV